MRMLLGLALLFAAPAAAQDAGVRFGPVFEDFGPHLAVPGIDEVPAGTEFSHSFNVASEAPNGQRNRGFESAARFINMHAAAGVDPENVRLAVVVHGPAVKDLLDSEDNASAAMVREMLDAGVRFIVCGQSAIGQNIAQDDMIEGVEMALSAMTAHALLQQRGYTVNPF
ncbi:DsrE family protein [Qipengyuania atrilutea]|uniref:DsrE family protein n=1 Tax=Qipengyuania atrilutea TaxID=2744473 RepID=A0A850H5H3_9SPHN|nr:DsrE family protein [Actirhodobacter atriluteus]NVD45128.1 DsrE family protein [Actirhodobacter atriluteus]